MKFSIVEMGGVGLHGFDQPLPQPQNQRDRETERGRLEWFVLNNLFKTKILLENKNKRN